MAGSPLAKAHDAFTTRAREIGLADYAYADTPVQFWDLFGEQRHPIRTTISEMGPVLLARLMGLNDTPEGVLTIAFRLADEQGLLILELADLPALRAHCSANAQALYPHSGHATQPSTGPIQT